MAGLNVNVLEAGLHKALRDALDSALAVNGADVNGKLKQAHEKIALTFAKAAAASIDAFVKDGQVVLTNDLSVDVPSGQKVDVDVVGSKGVGKTSSQAKGIVKATSTSIGKIV